MFKQGIIPTNVRLKTNIKTPKGKYIIKKAELALLNERMRSINNSITMFKTMRYMYKPIRKHSRQGDYGRILYIHGEQK